MKSYSSKRRKNGIRERGGAHVPGRLEYAAPMGRLILSAAQRCPCCGQIWRDCPCPSVFCAGKKCVNHCECAKCVRTRNEIAVLKERF
jgi:hypothetical protein